jgi:hypothetical protein
MKFQPGHAKVGGRVKGSRNKLVGSYIEALCTVFHEAAFPARKDKTASAAGETAGEAGLRVLLVQEPKEFFRQVSALVPKEMEITDSRLKEIPDHELDAIIEYVRRNLPSVAGDTDGGTAETAH